VERLDAYPRVREDLTVAVLDGEAVVYDDVAGDLHHLNSTATVVFQLLNGDATVEELAADLADAYGMPQDDVAVQVRDLVRSLADQHLLVGTEPDPRTKGDPEHSHA
jgi:PqqD family protein of HPr-rel-A system